MAGPNPSGLCMCGCGRKTKIAAGNIPRFGHVKGQPIRYINGHNGRKSSVPFIIDETTGCWEWQRGKDGHGYGQKRDPITKRQVKAHAWWYELVIGPVPDGLELDHLCRNSGCVNPDHLEAVTHVENCRRGAKAKLTMGDATEIRRMAISGTPTKEIATMFSITAVHAADIIRHKAWKMEGVPLHD